MDNMYLSGTGNNFLITENTKDLSDIEVIAYIADTNKDIDGVITYEIKDNNLLHMNYYNSDGSTAELCINGVRCLAKYANDNVANIDSNVTILTKTQRIDCVVDKDIVTVEVDYPTFPDDLKLHKIENLSGYIVDVGNPHFVIFDKCNSLGTAYHLKNKLYDILHSRNLKHEKFIETINEWCLEAKSADINCLDDFSESLKGYRVV